MKVAIIGTTAHSILGFRIDLIKSLIAKGHVVYAFAQDYQPSSKQAVEGLGAIAVQYRFNRTGLNPFVDLINTYRLVKQLKFCGIEHTFCYFTKPVIFGTLAAVLAGVKHRYAMLEGLGFTFTPQVEGISFKTKLLKRIQVFLYQCTLPYLNRLILLNNDDKADLIDHYEIKVKNITVLGPIGLNLADYPYSIAPIEPVSFLFIGRLLKEKGIFEYVNAAKLVKAKYPTAQFIILGSIDTENPGGLTQSQLDKLIDEQVVNWPGFVTNIAKWLQQSSVFVLPSYREGFPRSTQEAMAIGRAIITTDVAGCRETVQEGVNGFLVPPYSAQELADKMCYFIEHPEKIIEMGNNSYQIAQQNFNATKVNERLIELLEL
ncbi:glycosyltransferase family 4 protein [Entomomonas asaccharolytica]|uniref:Glycosyltransferase family 4 protein n=1 Tax=Entomomonas asaccharolytica TaxID=2785331 RepID=A0A974NDA5_9GAMM|nr:glycosyltransferase family 4 protein [Entomomonas asaccharolytica]QQP84399.1 glycosyltransferase family 4 protein [Entomomonas asaccharolytica]